MMDGLIPKGEVDERSIVDVKPKDLNGFIQCHFFAGIGGWAYALRRSGCPESRQVWTGSCPCQPFSVAGKGKGFSDERHLWPAFYALIAECKPATVFGEQVTGKLGREWLTRVRADLERAGYAVGAADLCAAGVGAPHIRQRLYWVADTKHCGYGTERNGASWRGESFSDGRLSGVGNAPGCGPARQNRTEEQKQGFGTRCNLSFWYDSKWYHCRDGKLRRVPIKPALFPLAHGIPGRMGLLRGSGNAIVPQLASEFIKAYLEIK